MTGNRSKDAPEWDLNVILHFCLDAIFTDFRIILASGPYLNIIISLTVPSIEMQSFFNNVCKSLHEDVIKLNKH